MRTSLNNTHSISMVNTHKFTQTLGVVALCLPYLKKAYVCDVKTLVTSETNLKYSSIWILFTNMGFEEENVTINITRPTVMSTHTNAFTRTRFICTLM